MSVTERQRVELYERLGSALGPESAEVLMEYLPPVGWNDVARRHDLDALRLEVQASQAGLRTEMADIRAEMHQQFSRMLVWLVGTILASVGAVLGLIGYVS